MAEFLFNAHARYDMGVSGGEHGPGKIGQDDAGVVFKNPAIPGSELSYNQGMANASGTVPWARSAKFCGVMPSSKNILYAMPPRVCRGGRGDGAASV